ncbi:MAG: hypothetical protein GY725_14985 [bacterium]|nr:hypothetical protein [bacterium]
MRFDTLEVVDQTGTVLRSCPIGGSTSCNCTRDDAGGLDRCTFDGLIAVASGAIYPRVSCSGKNCQQTCEDGLPGDCRWLVTGAPIYVNWNTYKTRIGFTGADDCDFDADGIACYEDNCPTDYNPDQADPDGDDVPSACLDNCPYLANADQSDVNGDGEGDACDPEADDDGQPNAADNCPIFPNPDQNDGDSDGVGDLCDNCPGIPNADQADDDSDGVGQICDNCTTIANSLFDPNTSGYLAYDFEGEPFRTTTGGQLDDDADGYGNACDGKFTAGDGNVDASDQAEFAASLFGLVMQRTCGTSGGEPCDKFDMEEASALGLAVDTSDEAAFQARNGLPPGPRCALCPLECAGDACDDDGDGLSDTYETSIGTDPGSEDSDGDGDLDLTELIAGSNPLDADSDLSPALRELAGGRVELSWSSSPGISYEVLFGAGIAQADSNGSGASLPSLESFATMVGTGASLQQIDDGSTTSGSPSDVDTRIYALQITGSHPETGSQMTVTGNPVGFVRIKLPAGGFEIIGMPFFADDDSIHVILGQQLDGASQEAEADRVLAFDALSQVYTSAFVFDSGGTAPGFDHRLFEIGGESTLRLGCGDAVFVHNRGPAQNLFLAGRLAREPHSHNLLAGMNLFAPCHAVSGRPLDATSLALAGATGGTDPIASDRVLRFVPETQAFAGQYFFDSGSDPSFDRRWFPETGGSDESFDLEAGQGYVYMNRGGPPDLVWLENVPYTLP